MKLGNLVIENKTALAPMAAVNCTSFRIMCRKHGAGLVYTQMYQIKTIIEKYATLKDFLNIQEQESPIGVQLIGSVDDKWEEAVKMAEKHADLIDINVHCTDPYFIQERMGTYLLKHLDQIESILTRCVKATKKPITVKIRSGWDSKSINAVEVAKLLEKNGASAVVLHPRTAEQKYGGKADWSLIKKVKQNVSIPIIGNGDIVVPGNAKSMLEQTKCDAVMIGREAMRNPPIFEQVNYLLEHGKNMPPQEKNARKLIMEFIELYEKYERRESLNEIQDHCTWFLSHVKGAPRFKEMVRRARSKKEIIEIVKLVR